MAQVLPFARNSSEAWAAYHALEQQARRDPSLMMSRDYLDRRIAAKDIYFKLKGAGR